MFTVCTRCPDTASVLTSFCDSEAPDPGRASAQSQPIGKQHQSLVSRGSRFVSELPLLWNAIARAHVHSARGRRCRAAGMHSG